MSSDKHKKYLIWTMVFFLVPLCLIMLLVIIIDPFFQYHKPLKGVNYLIDNQINQNPGIAKNFDYDSVIVGSSMTDNFDTNLFAEIMGLNTIKLSCNGAFPKDVDAMLSLAQGSGNEIKEVFVGVDVHNYKAEPGSIAYEIPEYLFDDNLFNDVYYLLNKDVILDYIIKPHENTPINEIYWFWPDVYYGVEWVAKFYDQPTEFLDPLPANYYEDNVRINLEECIIPYIESMPDTQFTFFFPPYSVLYWYSRSADGSMQAEFECQKQIMEMLFEYPNVRIFYFQNDYDYITNFDNYSDYTHFSHEMNDEMTRCFADGTNELTPENYEAVLEEMLQWLQNQDLASYADFY